MQSTAAANHARVSTSAWLATRWRSRFHLRKGLNSGGPGRPTRAVFHPQLGKQIANIMTVQTDGNSFWSCRPERRLYPELFACTALHAPLCLGSVVP